jgi:hypothetical protein
VPRRAGTHLCLNALRRDTPVASQRLRRAHRQSVPGGALWPAGVLNFMDLPVAWRAEWMEPAAQSVTGRDLPVRSPSAAWVFVKYRLAGHKQDP